MFDFLEQQGNYGRRVLDFDYEAYAAAEAELAWLNGNIVVRGEARFPLDDLLLAIIESVRQRLCQSGDEPAHLKVIGLSEGLYGVANLVSSFTPVELSLPSGCYPDQASVIINARVAIDAKTLQQQVTAAVEQSTAPFELLLTGASWQVSTLGNRHRAHN